MSEDKGPFGFDPDEFDRVVRDAGEGLRDAFGRFLNSSGEGTGWGALLNEFVGNPQPKRQPETTGETGDGVWVIYTVGDDGGARIEQAYPTELDALRANKNNTDAGRKVRFLPYGIAVSVLDSPEESVE